MNEQSPHTDIVNDWIIGYLTNSLTPEEMQSLQNWLNVSEENRKHRTSMVGSILNGVILVIWLGLFLSGV